MESWLASALLALLIYGLWGFFPKIAVSYINPLSAVVYQVGGGLVIGLLALMLTGFRLEVQPVGVLFAFLTGVCGVLGTLFYFAAASRGPISLVASLTALYPLITIVLAVTILHEPLTARQLLGMAFALLAIVLMAG